MLWQESVTLFIRELRIRGYSERTLKAYEFDLEKFRVYLQKTMQMDVESMHVDGIDREIIRGWMDQRLEQGNSVRTVSRKLATLKSLFRFLYEEKHLEENPTDRVKLPRLHKKPPAALSQDEVRQLLNAPNPEDRNYLMERSLLLVMYSCGLRVSEAAALKIQHLNAERRHLRIMGKGSKERIIPLQDSVMSIVLDYLLHRERELPESMGPSQPLFVKHTRSGYHAMNVRRIQYLVEKCGREAGVLSHAHPHLLRHSLATHLIEQGANVEVVRQTLGHEDLATTSIYVKASSKFLMDEHKKYNPTDSLVINPRT